MKCLITVLIFIFTGGATLAQNQLSNSNQELVARIKQEAIDSQSSSLVVIQNGQTIFSYAKDNQDHIQNIQSASKSVTAIGVEILLQDGRIPSLDEPMTDYFPEWVSDPLKSKITIRMLLNHTAGFPSDSKPCYVYPVKDTIANCASVPLLFPPGSQFLYSSGGSGLLQKVISQASGKSFTDFFNEKLFAPLGIIDASWVKDPNGHEYAAGGLNISTADMIKLGHLILDRGKFNGLTILDDTHFQQLVTQSQVYANYGLLFWLEAPGVGPTSIPTESSGLKLYYAYGYGGQFIIVWPDKNLIVVRTRDPKTLVMTPKPTNEQWDVQQFYSLLTLASQWK